MSSSARRGRRGTLDDGTELRRFGLGYRLRQSIPFYTAIAPWLIGTLVLTLYPLVYAFQVSFTDWDGVSEYANQVGVQNYIDVVKDSATWASLGRTGILMLILVPFNIIGGLVLATWLNNHVPGEGLWRTLIYLPSVIPVVASTLVWKMVFDRDSGAINGVLAWFHIDAVDWMVDPWVFLVLMTTLAWGVGGGVILNLAALQGVPPELHDAATIDGAGRWDRFRAVTIPAISPILFYQVVTGSIGALQTFLPALLLTSGTTASTTGGVPDSNRVYMVEVYEQFFAYQKYGYGSAMLWILFLVILGITAITFKLGGKAVFYGG